MDRRIDEIVKRVIKRALNEEFKTGDSLVIPGDESFGRKVIRNHYKMDPNDFEYIGGGKFVYKVKPKKTRTSTRKPKFKSQDLGRKEGETEQDYLERVRELNKKFADVEKEIEGEEWRPLQNTGRYFGGATDYTRSHEVSNMGRIRTIDFSDPMKSRISTGYDAPTRNARQFHLDTHDEAGEAQKTTPPIHTMVADAWLDAPEGNIEDYDIEHIDGNYHNNRADNLRYVLRKGRRGRKANTGTTPETQLAESVRRIIRESVRRALNEVSGWTLEKDDVTWVNDAESGASDKAWMVRLWPGSGYYLPAFGAYASSEEDALEKVVAYLDKEGDDSFFCDDYIGQMREELAEDGYSEEEINERIHEQFCYVDATMYGGETHYVFWENLAVYPYDEKKFR